MGVDRALGAAMAVLALLFLLFAIDTIPDDWRTQTGAQYFVVGPELFPRIAGTLCLVLGVLLAFRPDGGHVLGELGEPGAAGRVLALLVIGAGFVLAIGVAGFRIATAGTIALFLVTFGVRHPLLVAGYAVLVAIVVGFAFERLFGILLPEPLLRPLGL